MWDLGPSQLWSVRSVSLGAEPGPGRGDPPASRRQPPAVHAAPWPRPPPACGRLSQGSDSAAPGVGTGPGLRGAASLPPRRGPERQRRGRAEWPSKCCCRCRLLRLHGPPTLCRVTGTWLQTWRVESVVSVTFPCSPGSNSGLDLVTRERNPDPPRPPPGPRGAAGPKRGAAREACVIPGLSWAAVAALELPGASRVALASPWSRRPRVLPHVGTLTPSKGVGTRSREAPVSRRPSPPRPRAVTLPPTRTRTPRGVLRRVWGRHASTCPLSRRETEAGSGAGCRWAGPPSHPLPPCPPQVPRWWPCRITTATPLPPGSRC